MPWDAFISYSHAADGRLASALQSGLQRIARPWYRPRGLRVFRDGTGLGVAPSLWHAIESCLSNTRFLVLLASPEAAASSWVSRELGWWLSRRGTEGLLPVVSSGGWVWDPARADFDAQASSAVPAALRGAFGDEPRHLDLRWAADAEALDLGNPRFLGAVAELAAPMRGLSKDQLVGEDLQLQRRARRLTVATIVGLTVLSTSAIGAAVKALINARVAEERRVEATAQRIAVQSTQAADQPDLAFLLAAEAYRMRPSREAEAAVVGTAQAVPELARVLRYQPACEPPSEAPAPPRAIWSLVLVPELDLVVLADEDGGLRAVRRADGVTVACRPATGIGPRWLFVDHRRQELLAAWPSALERLTLPGLEPLRATALGNDQLTAAAFDPSTARVAFALADEGVKLLEEEVTAPTPFCCAQGARIAALAFSPDGAGIAVGDAGGGLSLWSLAEPRRPHWSISLAHGEGVSAVTFSADGQRLVSGGGDGWVRVWAAGDGRTLSQRLAHGNTVRAVAFTRNHPAGDYLASAGADGDLHWAEAGSFQVYAPTRVHGAAIEDLAVADDGSYASAGADGLVALFDARAPRVLGGEALAIDENPSALALEPGGSHLVLAGGPRGVVELRSLDAWRGVLSQVELGAAVFAAAWQPGQARVALGLVDGRLALWSPLAGQPPQLFPGHQGVVTGLAFDPLSGALYSLGEQDHRLLRWRVAGEVLALEAVVAEDAGRGLALSPADGRVAYGISGGGAALVADAGAAAAKRFGVEPPVAVTALAFHPGQPLLLAGDAYGHLHRWGIEAGAGPGESRPGHRGQLTHVVFAADAELAISGGRDGHLRLWSLEAGEPLGAPLLGHAAALTVMAVHPERGEVLSAGLDRRLLRRQLQPLAWIGDGCELFGRPFREPERKRFQLEPDAADPCSALLGGLTLRDRP